MSVTPQSGVVTYAPADIAEVLGDDYDGVEQKPWGTVDKSKTSDEEALAAAERFWTAITDKTVSDDSLRQELCEIGTENLCDEATECLACITAGATTQTGEVDIERTITTHILWMHLPTETGHVTVYVFRVDNNEPWRVERWAGE